MNLAIRHRRLLKRRRRSTRSAYPMLLLFFPYLTPFHIVALHVAALGSRRR